MNFTGLETAQQSDNPHADLSMNPTPTASTSTQIQTAHLSSVPMPQSQSVDTHSEASALSQSLSHPPHVGTFSPQGSNKPTASDEDLSDTSPTHDSDSTSDVGSTSTYEYDQESFETYRLRVLNLCTSLWSDSSQENVKVEHMTGGGFDRIIGISRVAARLDKGFDYILRVPRSEVSETPRNVAALQYVKRLGKFPVPDVIIWYQTADNELGSPYMIQSRIAGKNLAYEYEDLSFDNKCRVADELGQIYRWMVAVQNCDVGVFAFSEIGPSRSKTPHITLEPFFSKVGITPHKVQAPFKVLEFLVSSFRARIEHSERAEYNSDFEWCAYNDMITMAEEMHADGWFEGVQASLYHYDLEAYNILIDSTQQASMPIITGVIDWDMSGFAPSFMSCKPPQWIWTSADNAEEDEAAANDTPTTEEDRILKQIFEKAAGPAYMQFAYAPAYRLARQLVMFAIKPDVFWSTEMMETMENMLEEWSQLHNKPGETSIEPTKMAFGKIRDLMRNSRHFLRKIFDCVSGHRG